MTNVTIAKGQTLFDIAIQAAGSVEAVLEIAAANNISITDDLKEGTVLEIPRVINQTVADYFRVNGIIPKTGLREQDKENAPFGGIDFMAVEIDFIVS